MSKQMKGILLAAGGASLWGGSGAAAQYLFEQTSITTPWLVAVRLLLAGIVLTMVSLLKMPQQVRRIVSHRRHLVSLISFALLGMLNSQLTYFLAVKYSNAPTATVIQYLQPVIIIIWLAIAQRQWPRRIDCISIIIALIGTFLLVTGGHLGTLALTPAAIFWGALVCCGRCTIYLITTAITYKFRCVSGLRTCNAFKWARNITRNHHSAGAIVESAGVDLGCLYCCFWHNVFLHNVLAEHALY